MWWWKWGKKLHGIMTETAHMFLKTVALEAKKNGGGRPAAPAQALAQ